VIKFPKILNFEFEKIDKILKKLANKLKPQNWKNHHWTGVIFYNVITSYLKKLSMWIEWKENHNYALVLKNVEFWKKYNKTMKLTHHFVQWKNFVTKFLKNNWNMKTRHVFFNKIFYEVSILIKCKKGYQP